MGAIEKVGKDPVPLVIRGVDGLVVGFQHQIAAVIDSVERVKKHFPIDVAVTGEQMLVMLSVIILHVKRYGRMG